jgi:hypothetical protein
MANCLRTKLPEDEYPQNCFDRPAEMTFGWFARTEEQKTHVGLTKKKRMDSSAIEARTERLTDPLVFLRA